MGGGLRRGLLDRLGELVVRGLRGGLRLLDRLGDLVVRGLRGGLLDRWREEDP